MAPHLLNKRMMKNKNILSIASFHAEFPEHSGNKNFVQILRKNLLERIPRLDLREERKSYFLHQVSMTHELSELNELIQEMDA